MPAVFDSIRSLVPKRSRHAIHDYHAFDANYGLLTPFVCRDCVPGDNVKIYLEDLVREKTLLAPVMGKKNVSFRFFFVPYRILDEHFEDGVTGGKDGTYSYTFPKFVTSGLTGATPGNYCDKYTLWDYFGFPIFKSNEVAKFTALYSSGKMPSVYPFAAYIKVWNDYFRDEDLETEVNVLRYSFNGNYSNYQLKNVSYARDYFSSAALMPQKGPAVSFPISGMLPIKYSSSDTVGDYIKDVVLGPDPAGGGSIQQRDLPVYVDVNGRSSGSLVADMSSAATFDVNELRQIVQMQKIFERASRTGTRYTEWLRSFFSVSPRDDRLNRPEYIGGYRQPIINTEVLQTSSGDSSTDAVGAMKGHGISASSTFIGKYFVQEYGCILGVMYITPKVQYTQGIARQWLKNDRWDFYVPQLCNLGEQAIYNAELMVTDDVTGPNANDAVWGYQGNFSEMRTGTSILSGAMRDELSYWSYGRYFTSRPNLNDNFIKCNPTDWQRFYVEQTTPPFYVETNVTFDMVRPITAFPEPGRLDHDM